MAIVPEPAGSFFDRTDLNRKIGLRTGEDLWRWVAEGATKPINTHGPELPSGPLVVYRGQARSAHGLTSSLYRLCRAARPSGVKEATIADVESTVIEAMKGQGLGRGMSDGQLLSVLQHHGVPTRLIDFSRAPLEALFFAAEGDDAEDGRLFIVEVLSHSNETNVDLGFASDGSRALPWARLARGTEYAAGPWTRTVALADPRDLDPRMVAQRGVFLVGGLNRRYGGRSMRAYDSAAGGRATGGGAREIESASYADVTSLGINFTGVVGRRNTSWPASGWTIKVEARWKPYLRERLKAEEESIRRDSMYPPFDEVGRLATYAVVQTLGKAT